LDKVLRYLEGENHKIKLGPVGDITRWCLDSLETPVDVLMAGPPCHPCASNGLHKPGDHLATKVFCTVLNQTLHLIRHGGLIYVLLENVIGILQKMDGCSTSFMDYALEHLRKYAPNFDWRVDVLNAKQYMLPHSRRRVILQGVRRDFFDGAAVPPPLEPFGLVRLRDFLVPGLPATLRNPLTPSMKENLVKYEEAIQADIQSGTIEHGAVICCELDRAFGKTYKARYVVDRVPCLKTGLKYLFLISTVDMGKPDTERQYFRRS